jgi:paraquat-inducible protein A
MNYSTDSAAAEGLALCHVCRQLDAVQLQHCSRCGAELHLRHTDSLQRTVALLITAVILYIPANVLPIMTTVQLGREGPSTILGGVVLLIHYHSYLIAAVIFMASVMIPMAKMFALGYLVWTVQRRDRSVPRQRTFAYRLTELVGRWSMVDVFVVAILVALIQLEGLLIIQPGPAALAFGGVVVVTMLAAHSFDTRLIWDRSEALDG